MRKGLAGCVAVVTGVVLACAAVAAPAKIAVRPLAHGPKLTAKKVVTVFRPERP